MLYKQALHYYKLYKTAADNSTVTRTNALKEWYWGIGDRLYNYGQAFKKAWNGEPERDTSAPPEMRQAAPGKIDAQLAEMRRLRDINKDEQGTLTGYVKDTGRAALYAGKYHGIPAAVKGITQTVPRVLAQPIASLVDKTGIPASEMLYNFTHGKGNAGRWNPVARTVNAHFDALQSMEQNPEDRAFYQPSNPDYYNAASKVLGTGLNVTTAFAMPKTTDMYLPKQQANVLNTGSTTGTELFNAAGVPVTPAQQVDTVINMAGSTLPNSPK